MVMLNIVAVSVTDKKNYDVFASFIILSNYGNIYVFFKYAQKTLKTVPNVQEPSKMGY